MSDLPERKNPDNHPWGSRVQYKKGQKSKRKFTKAYTKMIMDDRIGEEVLNEQAGRYRLGVLCRKELGAAKRMSKKDFKEFMAKALAIDDDKPLKSYGIT